MPNFVLPNTQTGGSQTISAGSLGDAENIAAGNGTWNPGAGTFGANSSPTVTSGTDSAVMMGGGGGGGGGLGSAIQGLLGALASGNQKLLDEQIREFDKNFGLDQDKFNEAIRQFNQNFGLSQGQLTGTLGGSPNIASTYAPGTVVRNADTGAFGVVGHNGSVQVGDASNPAVYKALQNPGSVFTVSNADFTAGTSAQQTEQAREFAQNFGENQRQFNVSSGLQAAQLAASLHADPFRQQQVIGQLGGLLNGQGVAGFSGLNGSAADTQSVAYLMKQIQAGGNPAVATLNSGGGSFTSPATAGPLGNLRSAAQWTAPAQDMAVQGGPPTGSTPAPWNPGTAGMPMTGDFGANGMPVMGAGGAAAAPGGPQDILDRIPHPNQVDAVSFFRSAPGTQNMLLSGIKQKYGIDPEDAVYQMQNTLPQFRSPGTAGRVVI